MSRPPRGARKALASEAVFQALATSILRRERAPGSALPPERELSARFQVSRLIARQAMHRLRDMGLVSGGQGGQNTVLDPDECNDPRIVALTMELAPERTDERDVAERQLLAGAMLLELAQHRISDDEIAELDRMVSEMERPGTLERTLGEFESRFWTFVASCTRNKVLIREARWWFEILQDNPERLRRYYGRPELRLGAYRATVNNLRARNNKAAQLFTNVVRAFLVDRE